MRNFKATHWLDFLGPPLQTHSRHAGRSRRGLGVWPTTREVAPRVAQGLNATAVNILRLSKSSILLVPTLCVGMQATDALRPWAEDAEREDPGVPPLCVGTRAGISRILVRLQPSLQILQGTEIKQRFPQFLQTFEGQLADSLLNDFRKRPAQPGKCL